VTQLKGVLFHFNDADPGKQRSALRNVSNLLAEMPDIPVEIVIQGDALNLVVASQSQWAEELASLQGHGVTVAVCLNTMKAQRVGETELVPGTTIVPSAVGELVRRQQEGMSYVKP
jgi:intracellular sulfur oxidation DsrE/DsrF family protein